MTAILTAPANLMQGDTSAAGRTHSLPTELVGLRVVGWLNERFRGCNWWACALTDAGRYIERSNTETTHWISLALQLDYAKRVLIQINKHAAYDGAWIVAWVDPPGDNSKELFYMLWKDKDGDIQIPISNDLGWYRIAGWKANDHEEHCHQAHRVWSEWHRNMALKPQQYVMVAQGEKVGQDHAARSAGLIPT